MYLLKQLGDQALHDNTARLLKMPIFTDPIEGEHIYSAYFFFSFDFDISAWYLIKALVYLDSYWL